MRKTGILVALLLGWYVGTAEAAELTPERRQELEKKAAASNQEGIRYYESGNYLKAIENFRELLKIQRVLFPKSKYPVQAELARVPAKVRNLREEK